MIKPPKLQKGDTIGIISPSAPLAGLIPHRTKAGIMMLEKLGFKVRVGKSALKISGYTAGTAQERAADLNEMIADQEVTGIICLIGGNHSNQMLEYIDFHNIRRNPKVFIGYSDATVLHNAIATKSGVISFYGPAVLTQFAENPTINSYTLEYFEKAVMASDPIGQVIPSAEWTDEVLDWFSGEDEKRPRTMKPNRGWSWLIEGKANGQIIGGCITSLMHLRGTEFFPDFSDSIFFWEIPECDSDFKKGERIENVDTCLTDLELSGAFTKIKGMIVGRPFGYSEQEIEQLKKVIFDHINKFNIPVLFGVDIGHSDPMITVPLGTKVMIDSAKNNFVFLEAGVR